MMAYGYEQPCTKSHGSLVIGLYIVSCNVILYGLVTIKKHYFSNSASPMDTKLVRVVAYGMGPKLKKSNHS